MRAKASYSASPGPVTPLGLIEAAIAPAQCGGNPALIVRSELSVLRSRDARFGLKAMALFAPAGEVLRGCGNMFKDHAGAVFSDLPA